MAVVYIALTTVMGGGAPVYAPIPLAAQKINSTASSQQSTISVLGSGRYARITSVGGAVSISVGPNPTAVSGQGYVIPDGGTIDLGILAVGDKIACIDV